jgi:hypothetical protein
VEWGQYPLDLLALAVEKGEAQALAGSDPLAYIWLKGGKLNEVATNFSGEYANRVLRARRSRQPDPRRTPSCDRADPRDPRGGRPRCP